ncbi:hypothetical protein DPMN_060992 [Dreissena polymorpha]|uniref:Uncharacterized protein n=1 Tax=Dreissena polymorpha TaxID=45954 RepID=A0A9D4C676_DREPO|nr:hypothetical protein DPMN_060992 [Dreissena polymorpha]
MYCKFINAFKLDLINSRTIQTVYEIAETAKLLFNAHTDYLNENALIKSVQYWTEQTYEEYYRLAAIILLIALLYICIRAIILLIALLYICIRVNILLIALLYIGIREADIKQTTNGGDSALYLATFGVLSSSQPDISVLEEIIYAVHVPMERCDHNQTECSWGVNPWGRRTIMKDGKRRLFVESSGEAALPKKTAVGSYGGEGGVVDTGPLKRPMQENGGYKHANISTAHEEIELPSEPVPDPTPTTSKSMASTPASNRKTAMKDCDCHQEKLDISRRMLEKKNDIMREICASLKFTAGKTYLDSLLDQTNC